MKEIRGSKSKLSPGDVAARAKGVLGKKIVVCKETSDVKSLTVDGGMNGLVLLGVNDADSDDSSDGVPLIQAQLLPSQAVKLARLLLNAAGVWGTPDPLRGANAVKFTFID